MTEISLGVGVVIPAEQRLKYRITPLRGQLMTAESIGGQMVQIAKLLKAVARDEDPSRKWEVVVLGLTTHENGEVEFDLMIAPKRKHGDLAPERLPNPRAPADPAGDPAQAPDAPSGRAG